MPGRRPPSCSLLRACDVHACVLKHPPLFWHHESADFSGKRSLQIQSAVSSCTPSKANTMKAWQTIRDVEMKVHSVNDRSRLRKLLFYLILTVNSSTSSLKSTSLSRCRGPAFTFLHRKLQSSLADRLPLSYIQFPCHRHLLFLLLYSYTD